jgi:hypothetical protein
MEIQSDKVDYYSKEIVSVMTDIPNITLYVTVSDWGSK